MKPNVRVQLKKQIKARREAVFNAWKDPKLLSLWYAPDALTVPGLEVDFRVGGRYKIDMAGEMRGRQTTGSLSGAYKEIVPNERIVLTFKGTWQDSAPETLVTVEFRDSQDGTEITLTHEGFVSEEACEGHRFGWMSTLEKLSKVCVEVRSL